MKKKISLFLALLMGGTLALSACANDNHDAVIKGNYKQPTQAELDSALASINADNLFGNTENLKIGLSLSGSLSLTVAQNDTESSEALSLSYLLNADNSSVAGAGNFAMTETINEKSEVVASAALYNDTDYFYMDVSYEGMNIKGKLSYASIAHVIENKLPTDQLPVPELPEGDFTIQAMAEAGIDVWLDTSDGIKLKLSANDTFFNNAFAEISPDEISFTDKTLEIYLYINKDGLFEQMSALIKIGMENPADTSERVDIDGSLVLKRTNETVTLPSDLTDENKYPVLYEYGTPDDNPPADDPFDDYPEPLPDYSANAPVSTYDNVVKAVNFGGEGYKDAIYEETTDTIITYDKNSYTVYDANTGDEILTQRTLLNIYSADAYNGKVVFGLGESRQILITDIVSQKSQTLVVPVKPYRVAALDDCIVYCDIDQWCTVQRCDYEGNNVTTLINSAYSPYLTPNRDDNYVYVSESNISSCELFYINLNTNEIQTVSEFGDFSYEYRPSEYDGMYLHFGGFSFDRLTGVQISGSDVSELYTPFTEIPAATLQITENYSIVRSESNGLLIYDHANDMFVYRADFGPEKVYARADGTFVVISMKDGYAARIYPSEI